MYHDVTMAGRFLVIDGPDAAGTTLHATLLAGRLRKEGTDVLLTAEPTDGPIGTWIRGILKGNVTTPATALQLLFTADRAWHVETVITPALEAGKTVVLDRYLLSTIAYGVALGLEKDWLKDLNKNFVRPDRTILTLPPLDVCLQRLEKRGAHDILERQDLQEKIHTAYRALAEEDPSIIVIDTSAEKFSVAQTLYAAITDGD